jgi:hypothetical protein
MLGSFLYIGRPILKTSKKIVFYLVLFLNIIPLMSQTFAKNPASERFYPYPRTARWDYQEMDTQNNRFYDETVFRENEPVTFEGFSWNILRGQKYGNAYWVRTSVEGVFLYRIRRKIPILGNINVTFEPALLFLKFPLKKGDKWSYEGTGVTWIKNKSVRMDFENLGPCEYITPQGTVRAWKIQSTVTMGHGQAFYQVAWYGLDTGYLGGWNDDSRTWLKGWSLYPELKPNP